ncbi:MAG: hypothetical protein ACXWAC_06950 [Usitatibacter sp.]
MRRAIAVTALTALVALAAQANDGVELSLRSKTLAAAAVLPAKQGDAPFQAVRDPLPELMLREEQERHGPSGACEISTTALCYDLADRRVNFRAARQYMPKIDGLTAESVSLRHDRLVLKYSFR